jgi:hypothetical protein
MHDGCLSKAGWQANTRRPSAVHKLPEEIFLPGVSTALDSGQRREPAPEVLCCLKWGHSVLTIRRFTLLVKP